MQFAKLVNFILFIMVNNLLLLHVILWSFMNKIIVIMTIFVAGIFYTSTKTNDYNQTSLHLLALSDCFVPADSRKFKSSCTCA